MNPIDFIGDVHGCGDKLLGLLRALGYDDHDGAFTHPDRTAVFVGDLIDRGPQQVEVEGEGLEPFDGFTVPG